MSKITKKKISITVDEDIVMKLEKLARATGAKSSTYINRVLRRHFKRPGKGMEAFQL